MTEKEKRVSLWGSLFLAALFALIHIGSAYPITSPVWAAALVVVAIRGELWDAE